MTQFFLSVHWEKIESFWPKKLGQILVPPVTQLLGSKWLNYFSRCTEPNIQSFWPKKLGQILVPLVTQLLGSKCVNFFSLCTDRKIESFWPKKLGRILIPPVTQLYKSNDSIISLGALREKMSLFNLKSWITLVQLRQKHLNWN